MLDSSTGLAKVAGFDQGQLDLITRDPASFALTVLIFSRGKWTTRELYAAAPSPLHELLDALILQLSDSGVIAIKDGCVIRVKNYFEAYNVEQLKNFLPQVFKIAAESILKDTDQEIKNSKQMARFYVFPEDKATVDELYALSVEYRVKLEALEARALGRAAENNQHRFVGLVSYQMNTEDFV